MRPGGVPSILAASDARGPGSGRGTDAQGARMMEHTATTTTRSADAKPFTPSRLDG